MSSQQNLQNVPIDISSNKLQEWLISRRHCSKDWQSSVLPIREKINTAIQDMPVHEGITKLLTGTYINYFHCLKIVDILKETEKNSKNFFGQYGSKRMKDWQDIVRMYEKENLYLAEVAQMLARNVSYEVPGLRRQITKCETTQNECDKKEAECVKAAASLRNDFDNTCKQLGIAGKDIKRELASLVSELPAILNRVAEQAKSTTSAQKHYAAFSNFVLGRDAKATWTPVLAYVAEHGNTTTYEYTFGEPPLKIEESSLDIQLDDKPTTEDGTIDFGDDNAAIDFGDGSGEIDFGDSSGVDIDWGGNTGEDVSIEPQEIDFNISLEDTGIVLEDAGHEGGVATGTDALTVLDNPSTRNAFLDELVELESFLRIRVSQMEGADEGGFLALSQMQGSPSELQDLSIESLRKMLASIAAVQKSLAEPKSQHLHSIKNSPKYVDQLASKLQQKLALVGKTEAKRAGVQARRETAIAEAAELRPKLKLIIEKTKQLQSEIERDISKKYKGRPVNIMGGVNTLG